MNRSAKKEEVLSKLASGISDMKTLREELGDKKAKYDSALKEAGGHKIVDFIEEKCAEVYQKFRFRHSV